MRRRTDGRRVTTGLLTSEELAILVSAGGSAAVRPRDGTLLYELGRCRCAVEELRAAAGRDGQTQDGTRALEFPAVGQGYGPKA